MIRIRSDTALHALFPGDPLCLGTELACTDQTDPRRFKHTSDCISFRQLLKLYHSTNDASLQKTLKKLAVTFEWIPSPLAYADPNAHTTHHHLDALGDAYAPLSYIAREDPLKDPLAFPSSIYQSPLVSSCACSLESARRYRLTGTILTHSQLQAFLRRLISVTVAPAASLLANTRHLRAAHTANIYTPTPPASTTSSNGSLATTSGIRFSPAIPDSLAPPSLSTASATILANSLATTTAPMPSPRAQLAVRCATPFVDATALDVFTIAQWMRLSQSWGLTQPLAQTIWNHFLHTHPYAYPQHPTPSTATPSATSVSLSEFLMFLFLQAQSPCAPAVYTHSIDLSSEDACKASMSFLELAGTRHNESEQAHTFVDEPTATTHSTTTSASALSYARTHTPQASIRDILAAHTTLRGDFSSSFITTNITSLLLLSLSSPTRRAFIPTVPLSTFHLATLTLLKRSQTLHSLWESILAKEPSLWTKFGNAAPAAVMQRIYEMEIKPHAKRAKVHGMLTLLLQRVVGADLGVKSSGSSGTEASIGADTGIYDISPTIGMSVWGGNNWQWRFPEIIQGMLLRSMVGIREREREREKEKEKDKERNKAGDGNRDRSRSSGRGGSRGTGIGLGDQIWRGKMNLNSGTGNRSKNARGEGQFTRSAFLMKALLSTPLPSPMLHSLSTTAASSSSSSPVSLSLPLFLPLPLTAHSPAALAAIIEPHELCSLAYVLAPCTERWEGAGMHVDTAIAASVQNVMWIHGVSMCADGVTRVIGKKRSGEEDEVEEMMQERGKKARKDDFPKYGVSGRENEGKIDEEVKEEKEPDPLLLPRVLANMVEHNHIDDGNPESGKHTSEDPGNDRFSGLRGPWAAWGQQLPLTLAHLCPLFAPHTPPHAPIPAVNEWLREQLHPYLTKHGVFSMLLHAHPHVAAMSGASVATGAGGHDQRRLCHVGGVSGLAHVSLADGPCFEAVAVGGGGGAVDSVADESASSSSTNFPLSPRPSSRRARPYTHTQPSSTSPSSGTLPSSSENSISGKTHSESAFPDYSQTSPLPHPHPLHNAAVLALRLPDHALGDAPHALAVTHTKRCHTEAYSVMEREREKDVEKDMEKQEDRASKASSGEDESASRRGRGKNHDHGNTHTTSSRQSSPSSSSSSTTASLWVHHLRRPVILQHACTFTREAINVHHQRAAAILAFFASHHCHWRLMWRSSGNGSASGDTARSGGENGENGTVRRSPIPSMTEAMTIANAIAASSSASSLATSSSSPSNSSSNGNTATFTQTSEKPTKFPPESLQNPSSDSALVSLAQNAATRASMLSSMPLHAIRALLDAVLMIGAKRNHSGSDGENQGISTSSSSSSLPPMTAAMHKLLPLLLSLSPILPLRDMTLFLALAPVSATLARAFALALAMHMTGKISLAVVFRVVRAAARQMIDNANMKASTTAMAPLAKTSVAGAIAMADDEDTDEHTDVSRTYTGEGLGNSQVSTQSHSYMITATADTPHAHLPVPLALLGHRHPHKSMHTQAQPHANSTNANHDDNNEDNGSGANLDASISPAHEDSTTPKNHSPTSTQASTSDATFTFSVSRALPLSRALSHDLYLLSASLRGEDDMCGAVSVPPLLLHYVAKQACNTTATMSSSQTSSSSLSTPSDLYYDTQYSELPFCNGLPLGNWIPEKSESEEKDTNHNFRKIAVLGRKSRNQENSANSGIPYWEASPHPFLGHPSTPSISLSATLSSCSTSSSSTPMPSPSSPLLSPSFSSALPPLPSPFLSHPALARSPMSLSLFPSPSLPAILPVIAHNLVNTTLHIPRPPHNPLSPALSPPPPPLPPLSHTHHLASTSSSAASSSSSSSSSSATSASTSTSPPPPCALTHPPSSPLPAPAPLIISHCHNAYITALWPASTVLIENTSGHVHIGAAAAVTVINCHNLTLSTRCHRISLISSSSITIHAYTTTPPTLGPGCAYISIAPITSYYPTQHLDCALLALHPPALSPSISRANKGYGTMYALRQKQKQATAKSLPSALSSAALTLTSSTATSTSASTSTSALTTATSLIPVTDASLAHPDFHLSLARPTRIRWRLPQTPTLPIPTSYNYWNQCLSSTAHTPSPSLLGAITAAHYLSLGARISPFGMSFPISQRSMASRRAHLPFDNYPLLTPRLGAVTHTHAALAKVLHLAQHIAGAGGSSAGGVVGAATATGSKRETKLRLRARSTSGDDDITSGSGSGTGSETAETSTSPLVVSLLRAPLWPRTPTLAHALPTHAPRPGHTRSDRDVYGQVQRRAKTRQHNTSTSTSDSTAICVCGGLCPHCLRRHSFEALMVQLMLQAHPKGYTDGSVVNDSNNYDGSGSGLDNANGTGTGNSMTSFSSSFAASSASTSTSSPFLNPSSTAPITAYTYIDYLHPHSAHISPSTTTAIPTIRTILPLPPRPVPAPMLESQAFARPLHPYEHLRLRAVLHVALSSSQRAQSALEDTKRNLGMYLRVRARARAIAKVRTDTLTKLSLSLPRNLWLSACKTAPSPAARSLARVAAQQSVRAGIEQTQCVVMLPSIMRAALRQDKELKTYAMKLMKAKMNGGSGQASSKERKKGKKHGALHTHDNHTNTSPSLPPSTSSSSYSSSTLTRANFRHLRLAEQLLELSSARGHVSLAHPHALAHTLLPPPPRALLRYVQRHANAAAAGEGDGGDANTSTSTSSSTSTSTSTSLLTSPDLFADPAVAAEAMALVGCSAPLVYCCATVAVCSDARARGRLWEREVMTEAPMELQSIQAERAEAQEENAEDDYSKQEEVDTSTLSPSRNGKNAKIPKSQTRNIPAHVCTPECFFPYISKSHSFTSHTRPPSLPSSPSSPLPRARPRIPATIPSPRSTPTSLPNAPPPIPTPSGRYGPLVELPHAAATALQEAAARARRSLMALRSCYLTRAARGATTHPNAMHAHAVTQTHGLGRDAVKESGGDIATMATAATDITSTSTSTHADVSAGAGGDDRDGADAASDTAEEANEALMQAPEEDVCGYTLLLFAKWLQQRQQKGMEVGNKENALMIARDVIGKITGNFPNHRNPANIDKK